MGKRQILCSRSLASHDSSNKCILLETAKIVNANQFWSLDASLNPSA